MTEDKLLSAALGRRLDEEIDISSAEMTANMAAAFGITQQEFRTMRDKGMIHKQEIGVTGNEKVVVRITLEAMTTWTRLPDLRKK